MVSLGALLVVKLLLDQTSLSFPTVLSCDLLFVPAASTAVCLASGHLCSPVLGAGRVPCPCALLLGQSGVSDTAQPSFTPIGLGLWSPSTSLQGPECWCFSFDVSIWSYSSQLICFQPHWFSAKSRPVSCVIVAQSSEILRTKGKKYIALILIPKNSIFDRL